MLTYILPLEGGGVCVDLSGLLIFLQRSRLSFRSVGGKEHRHNKIGVSFNPRAATDISGSMKTCLWLDNWQECVRSKLPRDPKSWQSSLLPPTPLLPAFIKCLLR